MMRVEIRPEINLEVTVRRKSGETKVYTFPGDPATRWYRIWLGKLLTWVIPSGYPSITDIYGSSWSGGYVSPMHNCLFCDILAGKDSRSPSATDSKIYTLAKYTSGLYDKIDIKEDSSTRDITFGFTKSITMKESATLSEFGLVGRSRDADGRDRYFLVARDTGSVPVSSGDVVTLKYTVTLKKPSLTSQSGFTSWFNRALAAVMTGAGYANPVRSVAEDGSYLTTPKDMGTAQYSVLELYDPGNISLTKGSFTPHYEGSPTTELDQVRIYKTSTGVAYDDQSLGTEIATTTPNYGVSFSEATDYSQLTLSYWEFKQNPSTLSYTVYEYVFFGRCYDTSKKDRYYILHKGTLATGVGIGPNETVKAKIDFVLR
jgi:hypothetical protein